MNAIAIATEDELSENVGIRLVKDAGLSISMALRKNGNGYLRKSIDNFIAMSNRHPVLVITDLDRIESPERLTEQWFQNRSCPDGLLFHVAIREVEAWLLADHMGIKELLGAKIGKLPSDPELLPDPKAYLLSLAARAPRDLRDDLVAERNSMASQGFGYNSILGSFVNTLWQPIRAAERSRSLTILLNDLSMLSKST